MKALNIATTLSLGFGLVACSASTGSDGSDPGTPGSPGSGGEQQSLSIAGTYQATSSFEFSPADLNAEDFVIDFGDLAEDPIGALTDAIANTIDDGFFGDALAAVLETVVEDALGDRADDIQRAAQNYLSAGVDVELNSVLMIDGEGRDLTMKHYPEDMILSFGASSQRHEFAEIDASTLTSHQVKVVTGANMELTAHDLELPYNGMVRILIDDVLVPQMSPGATNLGQALSDVLDCQTFGESAAIETGFDYPGVFEGFCETGLALAASKIYDEIANLQGLTLAVTINGRATALDDDSDYKADRIEGSWDSLLLGSVENENAAPFEAERDR